MPRVFYVIGSNVDIPGPLHAREEPQDRQGPSQAQVVPNEEVRRQGLKCFLFG